jgi:hypothetical protein
MTAKSLLINALLSSAVVAIVAGCGSGEAAKAPTPRIVPEATAAAERVGPQTVKAKIGETLALQGASFNAHSKVRVTLKGTRGPFRGYDLPAGRKLIGVVLRFTNAGAAVYDDPQPHGELTLTGGKQGKQTNLIQIDGSKNPCTNPSLKLKTGQSRSVCLAFEVPKHAKPERFEFATDSGYGDTGRWAL